MKKIKWMAPMLMAIAVGMSLTSLTGCSKQEAPPPPAAQTIQYTCPMHPEVVQDKPGNCPKCGMKLVEKK